MLKIKRVDYDVWGEEIEALHKAVFPDDRRYTNVYAEWWLVFDGAHPVAFAALAPSAQWLDAGYLARAGVLPEYRGQGLQRRLIRARVARAKKQGWSSVLSDTSKDSVPSSNNLMREGFRVYRPRHPWSFKCQLYWRKSIK